MSKLKHSYILLAMGMVLAGSSVVSGKVLMTYLPIFLSQLLCLTIALFFLLFP